MRTLQYRQKNCHLNLLVSAFGFGFPGKGTRNPEPLAVLTWGLGWEFFQCIGGGGAEKSLTSPHLNRYIYFILNLDFSNKFKRKRAGWSFSQESMV
jgi:hypothetical protein